MLYYKSLWKLYYMCAPNLSFKIIILSVTKKQMKSVFYLFYLLQYIEFWIEFWCRVVLRQHQHPQKLLNLFEIFFIIVCSDFTKLRMSMSYEHLNEMWTNLNLHMLRNLKKTTFLCVTQASLSEVGQVYLFVFSSAGPHPPPTWRSACIRSGQSHAAMWLVNKEHLCFSF